MTDQLAGSRGRLIAGVVVALAVFGLQWGTDAYSGGFSRHQSDEGANFVTGVMAHDYLTHGFPANPIEFASDYYLHYPAVAIGHWPPMLYAAQAAAYLVAGPSLEVALVLNGLLTALAGLVLFSSLRRYSAWWTALTVCVLFVASRDMQKMASSVMAEPLMVAFALLSLHFLCRFAETARPRAVIAFAVWAGLAVLTKAVAWSLAPLPVLTALALRRFDWFRRPAFWGAHAALLVICLSWEISMSRAVSAGFVDVQSSSLITRSATMLDNLNLQLGWPLIVLGIAGAMRIGQGVWRGDVEAAKLIPFAILPASVCGVFLAAPVPPSSRYLILAIPALLVLAAVVLHDALGRFVPKKRLALATSLGLVLLCAPWIRNHKKVLGGFDGPARLLLSEEYAKHPVALVSSQSGGEVPLVAEAARIENPPQRYILRASKYLARTSWMNKGPYDPHVASIADTSDRVLGPPVSLVVLHDDRPSRVLKHHQLLREMVESTPDQWKLRETLSVEGVDHEKPGSVQIYELIDFEKFDRGPIQVDMTYTLGRKLSSHPDKD